MIEEVCERCYRAKNPLQMASFEYGALTLRACLTCMKAVLGVLVRTPLAQRAEKLRGMKERWKKRFEERAS